ncbi:MAG: ornithine cyclodeaminase [Oscillospiraceae bacterium]|nr:ornithine cyclodeaminase [Oscillospiraceae bacterium]
MGKRTDFIYLSEQDMIQAGALDSERCVEVMDEMFKLLGQGDYLMGGPNGNEHGIKVYFPEHPEFEGMPAAGPDRRFMAMVGYLGGRFKVAGEKWYGSNVANPARGLPRSILMIMLNDVDTCEPIALCSANIVSAVRTGAIPGVGVKYLANPDAEIIGLIGAGPIQKACLQGMMATAKNARCIRIFDLNPEAGEKLGCWAKETYGLDYVVCETMADAISCADIISSATSRLKPVEIRDEWLKPGSLIIFTGSGRIDESYHVNSSTFFDNPKMHVAYMDDARRSNCSIEEAYKGMMGGGIYKLIDEGKLPPAAEIPSLGDCACGKIIGRKSKEERICLMTGGMPTEDIAWSYDCYDRAMKLGLGTHLKLWDSPYWY